MTRIIYRTPEMLAAMEEWDRLILFLRVCIQERWVDSTFTTDFLASLSPHVARGAGHVRLQTVQLLQTILG